MIIQMRLNPKPPDPMQAKVMQIMPIVFSVMFFFFPAGLVLYSIVNNVLSITQQWFITRLPRPRAKVLPPNVDTIAAIATAQGRGGVGVVRISGRDVQMLAKAILGKLPLPRHATFANFLDEKGDILDQGIALYFPSPQFLYRRRCA